MNYTYQMKPLAAGLAGLGRGGDSMLVHMQPREVAGLQSLAMAHGGSLTTNPQTGLPEAGFLGDVLGAVAPIALGAALGPAGFGMSALGAGITTGLLGWAISGDPLKGLMSGVGAYGGAGLGSAVQNYVSPVSGVAEVGKDAASMAANQAANQTAVQGALANQAAAEATANAVAQPTLMGAGTGGFPTGIAGGVQGLAGAQSAGTLASTGARTLSGLEGVMASPLDFVKNNQMAALTAASPLLAAASPPPMQFSVASETKTPYEGPYLPTDRQVSYPTEEERKALGSSEYQYFNPVQPYPGFYSAPYAQGGSVFEQQDGQTPVQDTSIKYGLDGFTGQDKQQSNAPTVNVINQIPTQDQQPQQPQQMQQPQQQLPYEYPRAYVQGGLASFAAGGVPNLPPRHSKAGIAALNFPMKKGGYLDGVGDGMSDSIPATIEGRQPARLADGEFVVPADVVSHLGNGSTKAGAKRLYAMMDKVRQARTGTKQQGRQIKPEKYMPA